LTLNPFILKRMHYKVKKLTGFDAERLSHGIAFEDAFTQVSRMVRRRCHFPDLGI